MATSDDAGATIPQELGLADAMAYARELQKEARLEAADELYRRILAAAPGYPDAWHFRGVVAFQLGRLAEAETLIRRAVELGRALAAREPGDERVLAAARAEIGRAHG